MSLKNDDHLQVLTSVPHEMEAGLIVAALGQEGIRARASGILTAGFRAEAPGEVRILVLEDDLSRAQDVLESIREDDGRTVDWSEVDVGDPVEEE